IQGISPHVSCQENWLEKRKISIIVYLQEYSAADKILSVANFLPKQINLVILCSQKDIKDYLEANSLKTSVLFCEVVPFTEMPFAALKYAKNMEESYDYICLELFYDETAHVTDITQELEEGKLAFISNLFDSSIYINNIIDYFERNSFLGVVEAVYPNFSAFFRKNAKLRRYIGNLYKEAYEYFNIKSPYNEQIATSMTLSLWIKKGCIDFSSILENKKIFLSAPKTLEYLLPMFVQEKRYYWGRVFNTENIANILTNNECQMNGLTNTISSKIGVVPEVYMSYISGLRQVGHTNDTTTCSYTKRQILFINLNYVKSKIKKVRDFVKLKLKSYVALEKQDTSIIDIPVDLKSVVLRGDILSIRILCN
ncbi:MAG: rhamnan synthesis F family protein, partial [Eubacteriaceae bacterium]